VDLEAISVRNCKTSFGFGRAEYRASNFYHIKKNPKKHGVYFLGIILRIALPTYSLARLAIHAASSRLEALKTWVSGMNTTNWQPHSPT
jgi:hypothetical protein